MKKKCNNPQIGNLIGRFEFDLLSPQDREKFENHMLQCDACFQDYYENLPARQIIDENLQEFHEAVKTEDSKLKTVKGNNIFNFYENITIPKPLRAAVPVLAAAAILFFIITIFIPVNLINDEEQLAGVSDSLEKVRPHAPEDMDPKAAIGIANTIYKISLYENAGDQRIKIKVGDDNRIIFSWSKFSGQDSCFLSLIEKGNLIKLTPQSAINDTTFDISLEQIKINTKYVLEISDVAENPNKIRQTFKITD